jgi:hypothetical protein
MTNKLYWHGSEEFGWSARGSRGVGGDYWIVQADNAVRWAGMPASKISFQVRFQERRSGNTHWLRKPSDTLDEAKAIAQADNDSRRQVTAERAKGSAP